MRGHAGKWGYSPYMRIEGRSSPSDLLSHSLSLVLTAPALCGRFFSAPPFDMPDAPVNMGLAGGEMDYTDEYLKNVLDDVKSVALVGVSTNPVRPSFYVGRYLSLKGYRVYPVNPVYKGQSLFGRKISGSLKKLRKADDQIHMVDIFRRSEEAGAVVDDALKHLLDKGLKAIWMQIGVINEAAAKRAEAEGVRVVMNRCPKIEYQRLCGELAFGGFNTGLISSKMR